MFIDFDVLFPDLYRRKTCSFSSTFDTLKKTRHFVQDFASFGLFAEVFKNVIMIIRFFIYNIWADNRRNKKLVN